MGILSEQRSTGGRAATASIVRLGRRIALAVLPLLAAGCSDVLGSLPAPPAFVAVAAGGHHSCALTDTGVAYCWGRGDDGALGQGSAQNSSAPVRVQATTPFTAITAGEEHTCALGSDGSAWCWGSNAYQQLGGTSQSTSAVPVQVAGGFAFRGISAGARHTCGVTTAGQAICWGDDSSGQLGDGTTSAGAGPHAAGSLVFARVSAGGRHTCALTSGGSAYCWGDNALGQLGTGQAGAPATSPVAVSGGLAFTTVSAGDDHTCGIAGRQAYCWGAGEFGELGNGVPYPQGQPGQSAPVQAAQGLAVDSIGSGYGVTCANEQLGRGYCWGRGAYGQLGIGVTFDEYHAQTIFLQPGRQFSTDLLHFAAVGAAGETHTCGLSADHAVYCWGTGSYGELGSGSITYSGVPLLVQLSH